jgi:hypothetical protein
MKNLTQFFLILFSAGLLSVNAATVVVFSNAAADSHVITLPSKVYSQGDSAVSGKVAVTSAVNDAGTAKVYPNPFKHDFSIEVSGYDFNEAVLTDLLGKQIIKIKLTGKTTRVENKPELELIPQGVYFLTVSGEGGYSLTSRVIKSDR